MEKEIQKDYRRIQDIKDQPGKEIGLANKMSKLITSPEKARGRYMASRDIFGNDHPVTQIFKERASELAGHPVTRTISVGTISAIGKTATIMVDKIEEVVVQAIKRTKEDFPLSRRVKFGEDRGTVISHEGDPDSIYVQFDNESTPKDINIYKLKFA